MRRMDREGLLSRRTKAPPHKDTVPLSNDGYAIIRFRADNPGIITINRRIKKRRNDISNIQTIFL